MKKQQPTQQATWCRASEVLFVVEDNGTYLLRTLGTTKRKALDNYKKIIYPVTWPMAKKMGRKVVEVKILPNN